MSLDDLIQRAPKALLHDHLDGGLRPATVVELAREYGYKDLPTTDVDDLVDGHVTIGDPLGEARSGQELHDEEGCVVLHTAVVDRDDSGVAHPGRDPGLALEARRGVLVWDALEVDGLDGHLSSEDEIGAPPNLAHAPASDGGVEDIAVRQTTLLAAHPRHPSGLA